MGRTATRIPLFDRWNAKVQRTPTCWLWTGAKNTKGYGIINSPGGERSPIRAHRFAYEHFKGPISEGLVVRHKCNVPSCVNPDHLILGTPLQNTRDMVNAGRQRIGRPHRGSENHASKLTEEQVKAIRQDTRAHAEIAADYRVSKACITHAKSGRNWAHL